MKLHITGTEEAIKQIKRLEEIVDEAGKIIWALHIGTLLDCESEEENEQEKRSASCQSTKLI